MHSYHVPREMAKEEVKCKGVAEREDVLSLIDFAGGRGGGVRSSTTLRFHLTLTLSSLPWLPVRGPDLGRIIESDRFIRSESAAIWNTGGTGYTKNWVTEKRAVGFLQTHRPVSINRGALPN